MSLPNVSHSAPSGSFPVSLSEKKLEDIRRAKSYSYWIDHDGEYPDGHITEADFKLLRSFEKYEDYQKFVKENILHSST